MDRLGFVERNHEAAGPRRCAIVLVGELAPGIVSWLSPVAVRTAGRSTTVELDIVDAAHLDGVDAAFGAGMAMSPDPDAPRGTHDRRGAWP